MNFEWYALCTSLHIWIPSAPHSTFELFSCIEKVGDFIFIKEATTRLVFPNIYKLDILKVIPRYKSKVHKEASFLLSLNQRLNLLSLLSSEEILPVF